MIPGLNFKKTPIQLSFNTNKKLQDIFYKTKLDITQQLFFFNGILDIETLSIINNKYITKYLIGDTIYDVREEKLFIFNGYTFNSISGKV